jgi:hypothetical protein
VDLHPESARRAVFQILLFAYIGRSAGLESDDLLLIGNALQYACHPVPVRDGAGP